MIVKVVIAGGGTGGHLFPGVALAEEFTQRQEKWQVIFVGTGRDLEKKILTKWGFELKTVPSAPLKTKGWMAKIAALVVLLQGVFCSLRLLREISPRLVIGLGGYSSGPVLLAAYLLRIKRVIQEQNVLPGFANRLASRFSQRVFLSWSEGANLFPSHKVRVTGNPLRKAVLDGRDESRKERWFTVLILGGSQGAHTINTAMVASLKSLDVIKDDLRIIHQTGPRDHLWVKRKYEAAGFNALVLPFIEEMAARYREAHLVVCRAGATTISEICAWGRVSLLIPYPYAADEHQRKNAEVLVKTGAGTMMLEEELTGQDLAKEILSVYHHPTQREERERRAASLGQPDAATAIVDECYRLLDMS